MRFSPARAGSHRLHRRVLVMLTGLAAAALVAIVLSEGRTRAAAATPAAPVGIVNAFGPEQAAILNEMKVTGSQRIDGYLFYLGTIAGKPVVDTAGGEADETAELATYLLDTNFHPKATLFEGTAGAQNNDVHVGDVVLSGFVVDKSEMHYYLGGAHEPYDGEQMNTTSASDVKGDVINGHGQLNPTPKTAANYGEGPSKTAANLPYVLAYAAPRELVSLGLSTGSAVGATPISDATGDSGRTGMIANKVIAGVIGQADVWTEPLSDIEAQNMLYQTDAEENEGNGFAFANSQLGVPWLLVRGISDSVWYPNAYDGSLASNHAATVVKQIVTHLGATVSTAPETLGMLSPQANARRAGYLIANQAYYSVSPVGKVVTAGPTGLGSKPATMSAGQLAALKQEYTYAAGQIGGS